MNLSAKIISQATDIEQGFELHPHSELYGEMKIDTNNLDLMLRDAPTFDSNVITSMPKGSTFFGFGFTDSSLKWVLGQYTMPDGKIVAGFAHIDYLIKIKK
jgi:hypothetical protein